MFWNEGPNRSNRHNRILACYLAVVAGLVNSAGFIAIGTFTSHVTGNVGRLANDVATGQFAAAVLAVMMVVAFFVGATVASMLLESNVLRRPYAYGTLLLIEASLLLLFMVVSELMETTNPYMFDLQAMALCGSMGLQNSLVTRLSGAVVRTTHLTGIVTDLGIESARWFRFWRAEVGKRTNLRLVVGDASPTPPVKEKLALLLTIFCSFIAGSVGGAMLALHDRRMALLVPLVLLLAGAAVAFVSGGKRTPPAPQP